MSETVTITRWRSMIALLVLASLVLSAYSWTPEIIDDDPESEEKSLRLLKLQPLSESFNSAKTPTGHAFFSNTQTFPSLAQEVLIDDNDDIFIHGINYFSYDQVATLGAHSITFDDGGSPEGSYCYNAGMIGKMDSDGNWLWIAGVDCGLYNTGMDEDGDGQEDLYYGQVFINDAAITFDGGLVIVGEVYTTENISFISSAGPQVRDTASAGSPYGFVAKLSATGNWDWVDYLATDSLSAGTAPGSLSNCYFAPNAVDADFNGIYVGGMLGTESAITTPPAPPGECTSSDVGATGDDSSDGFITKYSPSGQQGWVANTQNTATDNNVADVTVDLEGLIHSSVAFQTSVTIGSDTHQVSGQQTAAYAIAAIDSSGNWDHSIKVDGGNIEESRDTDGDGIDDTTFFFGPQVTGIVASGTEEVVVHGFYGETIQLDSSYTSNGGNSDVYLGRLTTTNYSWKSGLSFGSSTAQSAENLFDVAVGPSGELAMTGIYNGTFTLGGITLTPSNSIYYEQPSGEGYANFVALMQPDGTFTIVNSMKAIDGTDSTILAVSTIFLSGDSMPKVGGWFYGDVQLVDDGDQATQESADSYDWFMWFPDLGPKDADGDGIMDPEDNCPTIPNPDQLDYDGDEQPGVIPSQSSGNFGGDECDSDDDEDRVADVDDNCPMGELNWTSNSDESAGEVTDLDGDGCKDATEDLDDDGDGICDLGGPSTYGLSGSCIASYTEQDDCPDGETGWMSGEMIADANGNPVSTDHDVDGCKDEGTQNNQFGEDVDDDNDDMADVLDDCPKGELNWTSNLTTDRDQDGCRDDGEDLNDDNDGYLDANDNCPYIAGTSSVDRRGCHDEDGDGYSDPDGNWTVDNGADAFPIYPSQWRDSDFDEYGDNEVDDLTGPVPVYGDDCPSVYGVSQFDRYGCPDSDADGYSDPDANWPPKDCPSLTGVCADALPAESTQWTDFDGDGYGDNYANQSWSDSRDSAWPGDYVFLAKDQDACPLLPGTSVESEVFGCPDADGDGWADFADAFPADACQYKDTDGDGYGDNPECEDYDDCLLQPGTSTADRLGCADTDGDGYSDPTSNWLPDDCGEDACADAYVDDVTQWKDTDGDGFGDNPNGTTPDQCIELPEDVDGNEDDDGCPEEEAILGGGLAGVFDSESPVGMIAIGAALLLVIVASVLLLRRRGGKQDFFDDGYSDNSQMEAYVQQMIAQGYPEATARAYAQQQFGAVAAAPAAEYAAQPVAAAPAQVAASTTVNPRMEAYVQQLIQQGYPEETARAYAMQYADRF